MSNLKIKDRLVIPFYFIIAAFLFVACLIYEGIVWLVRKIFDKDISIKWDEYGYDD